MSGSLGGLADYHLHSRFSDGAAELAELVGRAVELGLSEVGICDHLVPAAYDEPGYGIAHGRLEEYADAVSEACRAAAGVRVLLGVEVDFAPGTQDEVSGLLSRLPLDYAVVSVHFVDGFAFDVAEQLDDAHWRDPDVLYRDYYLVLAKAARWARAPVMVVGHPDVPDRMGRPPVRQPREAQEAALKAIAAAGLAFEVNSDGGRRTAAGRESSRWLLRRARQLGIPLTLGSDAHEVDEVGAGFGEAVAEARDAGFTTWLRLSDGTEVPLP